MTGVTSQSPTLGSRSNHVADRPHDSRLASLDGWRAISVLLVLGGHSGRIFYGPEQWKRLFLWSEGALGVLFFFVLSGFLITWLLLQERDRSGTISLRHFYIRRALRILPVFCAFMLVVALLQYFTPFRQTALEWVGNLTFTQNFVNSPHTTAHLWSLSVEEQFYLLWPVVFSFMIKRGSSPRRLLVWLAAPILIAPICRAMGYVSYPESLAPLLRGRSFFSYFDCLAIGCASGILLAEVRGRRLGTNIFQWRPGIVFLAGTVLVLAPYLVEKFHEHHKALVIFRVTLMSTFEAIGFALLMVQSVLMPSWGVYRILNWRWVSQIGVLSYSIYIWQQIFCTEPEVFGLARVWWMTFPGWLVPVFAVSLVTYYGLEKPILRLQKRFRV